MKKTLSVILSLLVVFSMCSVMAFAADDLVTVTFMNGDQVVKTVEAVPGTMLTPYAPVNPTKDATDTTEYTFKGWTTDETATENSVIYTKDQLPDVGDADVVYYAAYAEKEIVVVQTFWNFIESIFERINLIFEYFASVFGF